VTQDYTRALLRLNEDSLGGINLGNPLHAAQPHPFPGKTMALGKLASRQLRKNRSKCRQKDGWITGRCPKRAKMITIPSLCANQLGTVRSPGTIKDRTARVGSHAHLPQGNCRRGEGPHGPLERLGRNIIIGSVFLLLPSSSGWVRATHDPAGARSCGAWRLRSVPCNEPRGRCWTAQAVCGERCGAVKCARDAHLLGGALGRARSSVLHQS
jgi:hypothetical protein